MKTLKKYQPGKMDLQPRFKPDTFWIHSVTSLLSKICMVIKLWKNIIQRKHWQKCAVIPC